MRLTLTHRNAAWVCALLISLGGARIASTYSVFTNTYDEGAHLAAGMEWLDRGEYAYDLQHPPLGRLAISVAPYLDGLRSFSRDPYWLEGQALLYERGEYRRTLTLSRVGVLPFFVAASALTGLWAFQVGGAGLAVLAVGIFTLLPPVLGHAGVATTDMAGTCGLLAMFLAAIAWIDRPTVRRALTLGAASGLAASLKFSTLIFGLGGIGLMFMARSLQTAKQRRTEWLPPLPRAAAQVGLAVLAAGLIIWPVYRFGVGTIRGIPTIAPDFFRGLAAVYRHNQMGHVTYFMGETSTSGSWAFFPLVLGIKTPIAALVLGVLGFGLLVHKWVSVRDFRLLSAPILAAVIVLIASTSRLNLGVRHVLPAYAPLAVMAAYGAWQLWRKGPLPNVARRPLVLVLVGWLGLSSIASHPDYLAYFNEIAGQHPEGFVVDSDLDWGQDLDRLAQEARRRDIDFLSLAYYGTAAPRFHGLPQIHVFRRGERPTGWVAISETRLQRGDAVLSPEGEWTLFPNAYDWLKSHEPVARVGQSIRLYYLPATSSSDPD